MKNIERYKRQLVLPQVGIEGQKTLLNSTILVIGCGGLGSNVIPLLAAAGIGKLILCDDDIIHISNLNRQIIYKEADVNQNKVTQAAEFVKNFNSDIEVEIIKERINANNFEKHFDRVDLVVDCADTFAIKLFIHDACILLRKALIYGSAIQFKGHVLTVPPAGKPCFRCFFEKNNMKNVLNCVNSGVMASTVSVVGGLMANEAIKCLLNIKTNFMGKLQIIDLLNCDFYHINFKANKDCIACGSDIFVDPFDLSVYQF